MPVPTSASQIRGPLPALGSATHAPHVFDVREPWGGPRFHPPGEHPATYRWRQQRDYMLKLLEKYPLSAIEHPDAYRQICEALAYVERLLAEFEAGEDEAKRRHWFYIRDRLG